MSKSLFDDNNIVFTVFDDNKGPIPILTTLNSTEKTIGNRVAIRSIVSILSTEKIQKKIEGEAIIPFPDEKLIGFIYYVSLDQKTQNENYRLISLTFLTPSSSANQLYAKAALLSKEARRIGEEINSNYVHGEPLSANLKNIIVSWGLSKHDTQLVSPVEALKISTIDLYALIPVQTGLRKKYDDPLSYVILALLNNIPVVILGSDIKQNEEIGLIFQELFHLRELKINKVETNTISKADIILLSEDQYDSSKINDDPILILNLILKNHQILNVEFDKKDIKIVDEWLKRSRESKKNDVAKKIIRAELDQINDRLNQIQYLVNSNRESNIKEVSKILNTGNDELEFLVRISLNSQKFQSTQINKLLGTDKFKG